MGMQGGAASSARAGREHLELLMRVATRHYVDNIAQRDLAAELGYSAATVSRLLRQARELGVVTFHVGLPTQRATGVERTLEHLFGLRLARVAESELGRPDERAVAELAASAVVDALEPQSVLALSNGNAVAAVVDALPARSLGGVYIAQMIGSLNPENPMVDSPELCRRVAEKFGCSYQIIPAPLVVGTASLATTLRHEPAIATSLALASHADVALVGVGTTSPGAGNHIFDGALTDTERAFLAREGAVGHIAAHHYTVHGVHVESTLCGRTIAIRIDQLQAIDNVIAVAYGPEKATAILGALRARVIDTLVTDINTARMVIDAAHTQPSKELSSRRSRTTQPGRVSK